MGGDSSILPLAVVSALAALLALWLLFAILNVRQRQRARHRRRRNGANISAWEWVRKRTRTLRLVFRRGEGD